VPLNPVYYWRQTGTGPKGVKVGKQVLYRRLDVDVWWTQKHAFGT
jgi:hypothetical protein